ncbi:MAG TPA: hypothetical protein VN823_06480 [Stellaceae bacterium]|nr:hypothetical protein [Stellaceae bacterium]
MAPTEDARDQPLVGMRLDQAGRTAFFLWFNLEPVARRDARTTAFKPSGPSFRELVTVTVRTDDADRIAAIELSIARSFIEDPRQGMFAADIAKSFLGAALAAPDRAHMQHLIDTIAYGGTYAKPILAAEPRGGPAPQIERDSAPYLVWLGRNPYWRRPFDTVLLELENAETERGGALRLAVSAYGAPEDQPSPPSS